MGDRRRYLVTLYANGYESAEPYQESWVVDLTDLERDELDRTRASQSC